MYFFSKLALTLNEPEEGVAPTDSRLRPDQRLMENGKWDEANVEKQRLEEKQRAVRRQREVEAAEALAEGTGKKAGLSAGIQGRVFWDYTSHRSLIKAMVAGQVGDEIQNLHRGP